MDVAAADSDGDDPALINSDPFPAADPNPPTINLEPFVGMVFKSEVEAYHLYNEYSKQSGFGVRKKLCRRSKSNNDVIAGWYVCSRQGASVGRRRAAAISSEPSRSPRGGGATRVGCTAKLKVKRMGLQKWQVTEFVKDHNHELNPNNARTFRSHRNSHAPEHDLVDIVSRNAELREHATATATADANRPPPSPAQRFLSVADTNTLHMFLMRMRSKDPAFSYSMKMDKEQRVKVVFWADAMSKVAYSHFGDVVRFDTGYLTGKYKMPLVTLVGVNHHGQSILFGCALLADEAMESYVWLFQMWLEAMSGRPPKALITDRNRAISGAAVVVFPETHCRFCLWHVVRRVSEKLSYVCRAQSSFVKKFEKCVFCSLTDKEFERRWWKFIHQFGLMNDELLKDLYDERRLWAPVYLKDIFFGGMSISQRGENLYSFFDKWVTRSTNLKEFLEKYELALESKFEDEAQEDIRSFQLMTEERTNPSPFELQVSNVYTRSIFEKFQAEVLGISALFTSKIGEDGEHVVYLVKAYEMQDDGLSKNIKEKEYKVVWDSSVRKIHCICRLFEFEGYLCRHALAVLLASGVVEIPHNCILKRWTKDAKTSQVLNVAFSVQDDCSGSITQRFNDICVQCIKLAQEASLSKKSYGVALCALQEALERVVYENNYPRKVGQHYNSLNSGYYRVSEASRSSNLGQPMLLMPNHLGTRFVMCDPKVFQKASVPDENISYRVEKRAKNLMGHDHGSMTLFEQNVTTGTKAQMVNVSNETNIARNDMLRCPSQECLVDTGD